jgi:glycerate 2-kinase
MNILIAPNSMKGSLNAKEFADWIEKGFRKTSPVFNLRKLPIADGGDYTAPILCEALSAKFFSAEVHDPLGRKIIATYGIAGQTAIIEMAAASGLKLLEPSELNPEVCNTYGTGELMFAAIERGCRKILLGVGGSATIDGGIGMLDALGFRFFDDENICLPGIVSSLEHIGNITVPDYFPGDLEITILTDVNNPLLGEKGAAAIFGPQKGASPEMIKRIEAGMRNWICLLEKISGKELEKTPGMGAAGGIASGLAAFLNGHLVSGAEYIFSLLDMNKNIEWADWIITGEGRADLRGIEKKAPGALAAITSATGKPVTVIAGSYDPEVSGIFNGVFSIVRGPATLQESITSAGEWVTSLAEQLARILLMSVSGLKVKHQLLFAAENNIRTNNMDEAGKLLTEIRDETLSEYWYLRGCIYQKLQKWGDAINSFNKCLELDAGHTKATMGLIIIREILAFRNPDMYNP